VEADISRELPEALANPQQISQILINLVSNACEAMPEGGSLKINAAHEGNRVVIQVTDSGKGIAKDDLPRLFEPLFTTKPRGVGLGLAISKRLADLNHAEISASSQKGKGAVFTLSLPTA
jgi:signal transduction histidine kinase